MKTIEQEFYADLDIEHPVNEDITIHQCFDSISIDKQGAIELIKVLEEWVDENT